MLIVKNLIKKNFFLSTTTQRKASVKIVEEKIL